MSVQRVLAWPQMPSGRLCKSSIRHIKKALKHPKAEADKRRIFQEKIKGYRRLARPIIYLDESVFAHDMPRTHGYSPRGERCFGRHARGRVNALGAMISGVLLTVGLTNANIDPGIFNQKWAQAKAIQRKTGKSKEEIFESKLYG